MVNTLLKRLALGGMILGAAAGLSGCESQQVEKEPAKAVTIPISESVYLSHRTISYRGKIGQDTFSLSGWGDGDVNIFIPQMQKKFILKEKLTKLKI